MTRALHTPTGLAIRRGRSVVSALALGADLLALSRLQNGPRAADSFVLAKRNCPLFAMMISVQNRQKSNTLMQRDTLQESGVENVLIELHVRLVPHLSFAAARCHVRLRPDEARRNRTPALVPDGLEDSWGRARND